MRSAGYTDLQRGEQGSSEEHLTVTQFKVEQEEARLQRAQELTASYKTAAEQYSKRVSRLRDAEWEAQKKLDAIAPKVEGMEAFAEKLSGELAVVLPEAKALETGKAYREKKALPLLDKLVQVLKALYRAFLDLQSRYRQLEKKYRDAVSKNASLEGLLERSEAENVGLWKDSCDLKIVKRALGRQNYEAVIEAGTKQKQSCKVNSERNSR